MRTLAYWLAVAFVFTVPFEDAIQIGGIGRGSKLVGLVAGIVWLASVVERGRLRQPGSLQKAFFLFLVWSGSTFYWTIDAGASLSGFATYLQLFVLLLLLWDLFDSRRAVEAALQAYVLGSYVTCGSVIFNWLTATPAKFQEYDRVNALGFQVDGLALVIAIAAPAAWYLAAGPISTPGLSVLRRLNYVYVPIGLLALLLTGTRGATIASIPTALLIIWSLRSASGIARAAAAGAIVAAVILVIGFAPRGQLDRIATATTVAELGQQGGALNDRWSIWSASIRAFLGRPVGGVGLDANRSAVAPELSQQRTFRKANKEAHNTYVSVLTETGIVGLALFAYLIVGIVGRIRLLRGWELWYWSAQLAVLAIGAMSLSLEDSKSVWIFLSLAVSYQAAGWATGQISPAARRATVPLGTTVRLQPDR